MAARACGDCAASVRAIRAARSKTSVGPTACSTRPHSAARRPEMGSPLKIMSRARAGPTARGRRWVPPPPGRMPIRTSGSPICASSAAMRMSHASAISSPPRIQKPWIATMSGFGKASTRSARRWMPSPRVSELGSSSAGNSEMSAPALKPRGPAPRSSATCVVASIASAPRADSSAATTARLIAFTGGRSVVIVVTPPGGSRRTCSGGGGRLPRRREALAERRLAELARRALWYLSHEFERVGQPPFREAGREERAELVRGRRLPGLEQDDREGTLLPARVRDGDDRGFGNRWVTHERVFERDRADPLAPGLDEVLGAILDLDVPARVDGDDVAGAEPAIRRETVRRLGAPVVRASDPGTAHLELTHRLPVPGHLVPRIVPGADLDERHRVPLLSAIAEARLDVRLLEIAHQAGHHTERRRLGHAPGVEDAQPVSLVEAADHRLRRGRAADHEEAEPRQVVVLRSLVEPAKEPEPNRRHARGVRDVLPDEEFAQAFRIAARSGRD